MVLGITGISGSGKHTAAEFFAQRHWVVLDADRVAHHLYRPYTHVWKAIVKQFGETLLGNHDVIDRQKLGSLVFDYRHPQQAEKNRLALNSITHPAIRRYLKDQIHRHFRRQSKVLVLAALFKELELPEFCDKILWIKVSPAVAAERLKKRDGISLKEFEQRILHQSVPSRADFVVENNGTIPEFYKALTGLDLE